jgi:hypothetical protein
MQRNLRDFKGKDAIKLLMQSASNFLNKATLHNVKILLRDEEKKIGPQTPRGPNRTTIAQCSPLARFLPVQESNPLLKKEASKVKFAL